MIKKRSLLKYILLNAITLGIYGLVQLSIMGDEVNKICEGDGKKQMHYMLAWLLGCITLGIYPLYWFYTAMERLKDNAYRYGNTVQPPYSGSTFLLWYLLGSIIVVGPLIAICDFIKDVNAFADAYGVVNPLPYTSNIIERNSLTPSNNYGVLSAGSGTQQDCVNMSNSSVQNFDKVPETGFAPGYRPVNLQGTLECISGDYMGIPFPMQDRDTLVIGTNAGLSNIVLSDTMHIVSGKHCVVSFNATENVYTVTDCSTNGTFINNERISKNVPTRVLSGSVMYLGDNRNAFKFK